MYKALSSIPRTTHKIKDEEEEKEDDGESLNYIERKQTLKFTGKQLRRESLDQNMENRHLLRDLEFCTIISGN
jgi:hypothetical protein